MQYLLQGSIRKARNRICINAQLVKTQSGHQVWAEGYDREHNDVFALQYDITGQIVAALSLRLSDDEKRHIRHRTTHNSEAYELFLQARRFSNITTRESGIQAVDLYRKAIKLDKKPCACLRRPFDHTTVTDISCSY